MYGIWPELSSWETLAPTALRPALAAIRAKYRDTVERTTRADAVACSAELRSVADGNEAGVFSGHADCLIARLRTAALQCRNEIEQIGLANTLLLGDPYAWTYEQTIRVVRDMAVFIPQWMQQACYGAIVASPETGAWEGPLLMGQDPLTPRWPEVISPWDRVNATETRFAEIAYIRSYLDVVEGGLEEEQREKTIAWALRGVPLAAPISSFIGSKPAELEANKPPRTAKRNAQIVRAFDSLRQDDPNINYDDATDALIKSEQFSGTTPETIKDVISRRGRWAVWLHLLDGTP